MNFKGCELRTLREIIDFGLAIKDETEQKEFVKEVRLSGPFALQNVGYFAGYYDRETKHKIFKVFGTAHPIFGTHDVDSDEAFAAGKLIGKTFLEERS